MAITISQLQASSISHSRNRWGKNKHWRLDNLKWSIHLFRQYHQARIPTGRRTVLSNLCM